MTLTISGGGLRSVAGLGVIKRLEEFGIEIEAVSGTSGGSIIGYLYCSGLSVNEVLDFIKNFNKYSLLRPTKGSLLSLKGLEKELSSLTLKKEFHACATNLRTGEYEFFSDLPGVIASSTLVPFFPPVKIDGEYYVDGGYSNNLPNIVFTDRKNISINVNNVPTDKISFYPWHIARRLLTMSMNASVKCPSKKADVFIDVDTLTDVGLFDFSKIDYIFNEGYIKAEEKLKNL